MADENKSLDLLGIKGLSDSVKIATERTLDGAAAFLSRVCNPALEELGLALRDRVSAWRARNATSILCTANYILPEGQPGTQDARIHPRLVFTAMEEGSWTDDEVVQRLWAGLLVSSTSTDGKSDENLIFLNLLKQLSSLEVRVILCSVERADKYDAGNGLPAAHILLVDLPELCAVLECSDLQRIDRELDHLRELGFIEGGIEPHSNSVQLTPKPLALHLYVRAQGSKLSPVEYWKLNTS